MNPHEPDPVRAGEREPEDTRLVVEPKSDQPSPRGPRILLTNDDGIDSPGLRMLAQRLARKHDVIVVAPDADRSGSGTGIGRFDPDEGVKLLPAGFEGVDAYRIAGPPGLAVMAGALGAFGRRPDLVVSGINAGMNTGHSVIHSGTVGAALTARTFGSRGLAVSLAAADPWHWGTAVEVADRIVTWLLARPLGRPVLNVNVPSLPMADLRGVTWAPLDEFGYFRVATTDRSQSRLSFGVAARDSGRDPACDTARCLEGFVTLTALTAVAGESVAWVAPEEVCAL
jgi:5'-nucleotidase